MSALQSFPNWLPVLFLCGAVEGHSPSALQLGPKIPWRVPIRRLNELDRQFLEAAMVGLRMDEVPGLVCAGSSKVVAYHRKIRLMNWGIQRRGEFPILFAQGD